MRPADRQRARPVIIRCHLDRIHRRTRPQARHLHHLRKFLRISPCLRAGVRHPQALAKLRLLLPLMVLALSPGRQAVNHTLGGSPTTTPALKSPAATASNSSSSRRARQEVSSNNSSSSSSKLPIIIPLPPKSPAAHRRSSSSSSNPKASESPTNRQARLELACIVRTTTVVH
jgi:hypothetical protein